MHPDNILTLVDILKSYDVCEVQTRAFVYYNEDRDIAKVLIPYVQFRLSGGEEILYADSLGQGCSGDLSTHLSHYGTTAEFALTCDEFVRSIYPVTRLCCVSEVYPCCGTDVLLETAVPSEKRDSLKKRWMRQLPMKGIVPGEESADVVSDLLTLWNH